MMKFIPFSRSSLRGWVAPDLELPAEVLENLEHASPPGEAELLLECQGRRIIRLPLRLGNETASCFVYFFRNASIGRSLRSTYAFHIKTMAQSLQRAGVNSLEVLAALKPSGEILNWSSLLIAREIDSVYELPSVGSHVFHIHDVMPFTPSVADKLAEELARFHSKKFAHGDLKTRHLLARNGDSGSGRFQIFIVDLEKTQRLVAFPALVRDIFAARDLVQLLCSLPETDCGEDLEPVRRRLIEQYFSERRISSRREGRMRKILQAYAPGGPLTQGKTLLQSLLDRSPLRKGKKDAEQETKRPRESFKRAEKLGSGQ